MEMSLYTIKVNKKFDTTYRIGSNHYRHGYKNEHCKRINVCIAMVAMEINCKSLYTQYLEI